MSFRPQREGVAAAATYIERLPATTVWGLEATDDDQLVTLNIFAPSEQWASIVMSLRLPTNRVFDRNTKPEGEQFVAYRVGTLVVSLIEEDK